MGGYTSKHTLQGHTSTVSCVDADEKWIVSGSVDTTVKAWAREPPHELARTLEGHAKAVMAVAVAGDTVISASYDKTVRVTNASNGAVQRIIKLNSSMRAAAVRDDLLFVGDGVGVIAMWSVASGRQLYTTEQNSGMGCITGLALDAAGQRLLSTAAKGVCTWTVTPTGLQLQHTLDDKEAVCGVWNSKYVAAGHKGVRVWRADTGQLEHEQVKLPDDIWCLALADDDDTVFAGLGNGYIVAFSLSRGVPVAQPVAAHASMVTSLCNMGGGLLVSGSTDKIVKTWEAWRLMGADAEPAPAVEQKQPDPEQP